MRGNAYLRRRDFATSRDCRIESGYDVLGAQHHQLWSPAGRRGKKFLGFLRRPW